MTHGTPGLLEKNGHLYALYAGPWRNERGRFDHFKPHDVIESLFAESLIDTTDQPTVHNGAVYLLYK